MTSIDLYDELIKNTNKSCRPSTSESIISDSHPKVVDQFEIQIIQIRDAINQIKENNSDIMSFKDRLVVNSIPKQQYQLCNKIQAICQLNYQIILSIKEKLKKVSAIVKKLKQTDPAEPETFSKIYKKQHIQEEVDKILMKSLEIQKIVQRFNRQNNGRRIKILMPQASQEQIQKISKEKNGMQLMVEGKVLGKESLKLSYERRDILQKYQGIVKLQKSIQQNLMLIKEVALMVQQQGQMIDDIYKNVLEAKDYADKAFVLIDEEKKKHKTSRKKICCIILVAILLLGLISVPIILKVINDNKTASS